MAFRSNGDRSPAVVRLALGCVVGMTLLAGCDGGSDVPSTPASTTASAPTPAATTSSAPTSTAPTSATGTAYVPVKPAFPAAAKKQTLKSAEAFVKYFYELVNYAYAKPEAGLLGPLGTAACETCKNYEKIAADLVAENQRYAGPMVTFKRVSFSTVDVKDPWIIFNGEQPGSHIVDAHGKTVYVSKKVPLHIRLVLAWTSKGWRIQELSNT